MGSVNWPDLIKKDQTQLHHRKTVSWLCRFFISPCLSIIYGSALVSIKNGLLSYANYGAAYIDDAATAAAAARLLTNNASAASNHLRSPRWEESLVETRGEEVGKQRQQKQFVGMSFQSEWQLRVNMWVSLAIHDHPGWSQPGADAAVSVLDVKRSVQLWQCIYTPPPGVCRRVAPTALRSAVNFFYFRVMEF